jgi:hypothetical protein
MAAAGYIIHLTAATEREPLVAALLMSASSFVGCPLQIFPAADGRSWEQHPMISKAHIRPKTEVTRGMLGCAKSHLDILLTSYKRKLPTVAIFEDDCEMVGPPAEIRNWLAAAPAEWDLLLLGANEYVDIQIGAGAVGQYQPVQRFWGTHAMLVSRRAMHAALKIWAEAQKGGVFLPADWMWNEAIRREGLRCWGPAGGPTQFVRQKEGLRSAITGHIRGGGD